MYLRFSTQMFYVVVLSINSVLMGFYLINMNWFEIQDNDHEPFVHKLQYFQMSKSGYLSFLDVLTGPLIQGAVNTRRCSSFTPFWLHCTLRYAVFSALKSQVSPSTLLPSIEQK